jgi:hypothetical protein
MHTQIKRIFTDGQRQNYGGDRSLLVFGRLGGGGSSCLFSISLSRLVWISWAAGVGCFGRWWCVYIARYSWVIQVIIVKRSGLSVILRGSGIDTQACCGGRPFRIEATKQVGKKWKVKTSVILSRCTFATYLSCYKGGGLSSEHPSKW